MADTKLGQEVIQVKPGEPSDIFSFIRKQGSHQYSAALFKALGANLRRLPWAKDGLIWEPIRVMLALN